MLDAIIIGGGFYGVSVANYLVEKRRFGSIALVEQERALLQRASLVNQSRIHNGYHYPRSFTTAYRSRVNLPRFVEDFPNCICRDGFMVYAVARRNSRITARQFRRFCTEIGARLEQTPASIESLFDRSLIEGTFLVEEFAFDAAKLAKWGTECLANRGVDVKLCTRVKNIRQMPGESGVSADLENEGGMSTLRARFIFNCTYSGLNQFGGDFTATRGVLKHELTEMALIDMPESLAQIGVTLMDGPFFSIMPYPTLRSHTLSHVRYTPHAQWTDCRGEDPYSRLSAYAGVSRADWMMRDARRYLPELQGARYLGSLYEIKTVLAKNEVDDGRPILFESHESMPGCYSILGGKIDNIYDVLERLDAERL